MDSSEVIDEIQRIQNEHGSCSVVIVDEMEPDWKYPVSNVEFDPDNQAITISASR